jgi:hypothetical protein
MAGESIMIHTEAKIIHHKSSSSADPDKKSISDEQYKANEIYYFRKWGGLPQNEIFTTPFGNPNLNIKDW